MPHLKTRNAHCKQAPQPDPAQRAAADPPDIQAGARPCL